MAGPIVRLDSDEIEDVRRWRFHELRRFGYLRPDAEYLAESEIDIRALEALLARGCPREVAARILI